MSRIAAPPGLPEAAAQVVLFVQAFEESDRDGLVLPFEARRSATRRALRVTGVIDWRGKLSDAEHMRNGETLLRRSRVLFERLVRTVGPMGGVLHIARLGSSTGPAVLAVALTAGWGLGWLVRRHGVEPLPLPLLGLLAWNLCFYAIIATASVPALGRLARGSRAARALARDAISKPLAGVLLKWALWRRLRAWRLRRVETAEQVRIVAKAFIRFGALWHRLAGDLLAARVRRILHLAAVALMLGAVGGAFLGGPVLDHRATLAGALLGERQTRALIDTVLGPAAAILRLDVPDIAPPSPNPVPWIELWTVTALLFVGLPRIGLALSEGVRCKRLAGSMQVDVASDHVRRVFSEWRGATSEVHVVPHAFEPTPGELAALEGLLLEFFGARARITVHPAAPCDEGDALDHLLPERSSARWTRREAGLMADEQPERSYVMVFDLTHAPDSGGHVRTLESLKARVAKRGERLVVLALAGTYRDSIADPRLLNERGEAWERVAQRAGLPLVALAPDRCNRENAIAALGQALWPAEAGASAGA